MKNILLHIRVFIFRGLLAMIPIILCAVALQLLYVLIDKKIVGFLENFVEIRNIPGLGILLLVISLYILGLIVSNIVGHQIFAFIERISQRIPVIKTIYGIGKQLSKGLSAADGQSQAFKKAVLVKLGPDGLMVPALVMSSMKGRKSEEEFLFVLVPSAPTPASGYLCVVKATQTFDPGWTVEECLNAIVSIGIVTPKEKGLDL